MTLASDQVSIKVAFMFTCLKLQVKILSQILGLKSYKILQMLPT